MDKWNHIEIWTDGACSGNPGKGGWAASVNGDIVSGSESWTTNNEMEMMAILMGLEQCPYKSVVHLYTDSKLCIGWLKHGWKCESNLRIADMIDAIRITCEARMLAVKLFKVKGHSGIKQNERVDYEANLQSKLV